MSSYPTRVFRIFTFSICLQCTSYHINIYYLKIFITGSCLLKNRDVYNNCYICLCKKKYIFFSFLSKICFPKKRKQMINTQISQPDLDCHYLRRCFFSIKMTNFPSVCFFTLLKFLIYLQSADVSYNEMYCFSIAGF